jgi:3D (Asp-Asp-Asp) domain-containing protein
MTTFKAVVSTLSPRGLSKTQLKLVAGGVALLSAAGLLAPLTTSANVSASLVSSVPVSLSQQFPVNGSLDIATITAAAATPKKVLPKQKPAPKIIKDLGYVVVTGYTSTPDQTDSTPFTTATGDKVRWGIVACNFLPFGTKVKIDGFPGTTFTVMDRGGSAFDFDIWFPEYNQAINWGRRTVKAYVVQ